MRKALVMTYPIEIRDGEMYGPGPLKANVSRRSAKETGSRVKPGMTEEDRFSR
jgi:hypothetical protein